MNPAERGIRGVRQAPARSRSCAAFGAPARTGLVSGLDKCRAEDSMKAPPNIFLLHWSRRLWPLGQPPKGTHPGWAPRHVWNHSFGVVGQPLFGVFWCLGPATRICSKTVPGGPSPVSLTPRRLWPKTSRVVSLIFMGFSQPGLSRAPFLSLQLHLACLH